MENDEEADICIRRHDLHQSCNQVEVDHPSTVGGTEAVQPGPDHGDPSGPKPQPVAQFTPTDASEIYIDVSRPVAVGTDDNLEVNPFIIKEGKNLKELMSQSHLVQEGEDLMGLISEAILRFEAASESEKKSILHEVSSTLAKLLHFTIRMAQDGYDESSTELICENVGFMDLFFGLLQGQFMSLITTGGTEIPVVKLLQTAHLCLGLWTNASKSFTRSLKGNIIHHFMSELKALNAVWMPDEELVCLGDVILRIIGNCSNIEECHGHLLKNNCPSALLPLCFSPRIQTSLQARFIVAALYQNLGPTYSCFLELLPSERNLIQQCLLTAALDEEHVVELQLGKSRVIYSALELMVGLSNLIQNEAQLPFFITREVFESIMLLLQGMDDSEKIAAAEMLCRLLKEPSVPSLIQTEYPTLVEELQSLNKYDNILVKEKVCFALHTLGRDEEFVMASGQAEVKAKPTVTKSILSEREAELQQLLQWNLKCIKDSSVVCGAEDSDPVEVTLALIYLASFFCEQWNQEGQKLCSPLVDCTVKKSDFLGYLQDFMQRHFIVSLKKETAVHQLHPLVLALNCLLMWTSCSYLMRKELGRIGIVGQMVGQLRILQAIPALDKNQLKLAELLLFTVANCALEPSCQEYLLQCKAINTLLPYCKSFNFQIRLGAKRVLSSLSAHIDTRRTSFLQLAEGDELGVLALFTREPHGKGIRTLQHATSGHSYSYSMLDLLMIINSLVMNRLNRTIIASHDVYPTILALLYHGSPLLVKEATGLLNQLYKDDSASSCIRDSFPGLLSYLTSLEQGSEAQTTPMSTPTINEEKEQEHKPSMAAIIQSAQEVTELETLMFEAMDAMNRSFSSGDDCGESLNTAEIMNLFTYLTRFFQAHAQPLCKVAADHITTFPNFLRITLNVLMKLFFSKAETGDVQDMKCLLLIFHCLHQWIHYSEDLKRELGENGLISKLVVALLLLHAFPRWDKELHEFAEATVSLLFQCMTQSNCQTYFLGVWSSCEDVLLAMAKSPDFELRHNCKMIFSSLCRFLHPKCTDAFELNNEEIGMMLMSLNMSVNPNTDVPPDTSESHGSYSTLEILKAIIQLIQNKANQQRFSKSDIYLVIGGLIARGTELEQESACELLWKMSTKPMEKELVKMITKSGKKGSKKPAVVALKDAVSIPEEFLAISEVCAAIKEAYPDLIASLTELCQSDNRGLKLVASCTLVALRCPVMNALHKELVLMYIEGCCKYGKYAECVKLAHLCKDDSDENVKLRALFYKGKALYYLHTAEKRFLKMLPVSTREYSETFNFCYGMAKEAISLLSYGLPTSATPSNVKDEEAQMLLDYALLDYIRETNDSNLVRCLLCHGRKKLKKSHIWPASILDHFTEYIHRRNYMAEEKVNSEGGGTEMVGTEIVQSRPVSEKDVAKKGQTRTKNIFNVSWEGLSHLQGPKAMGLTFHMLCSDCEQLLSSSCENAFKSHFFMNIYRTDNPQSIMEAQCIEYGEYLYRFCLSIVFRAIPILREGISVYGNNATIYKLFTICRQYLLEESSSEKPMVALIISPTSLPMKTPHASSIYSILYSAGVACIATHSLEDAPHTITLKGRFLLVSLGVINILVGFEPSFPLVIPPECVIQPCGGTYRVPPDTRRYYMLPLGLWREMNTLAKQYGKRLLQAPSMHLKYDWLKKEMLQVALSLSETDPYVHDSTVLNYLPSNFVTTKPLDPGGKLSLPDGHHILLHAHHVSSDNVRLTIFLAVGEDPSGGTYTTDKPYAILCLGTQAHVVCIGYFISDDEPVVTTNLNKESRVHLRSIENVYHARERINNILPQLLRVKGFFSIQSLLFWIRNKGESLVLDTRCMESCWYCVGRCNNCMRPTSFDQAPMEHYHTPIPVDVRYCSVECSEHYNFTRFISPIRVGLLKQEQFSQGPGCHMKLFTAYFSIVEPDLTRSRVAFSVYLGNGSPDYPSDQPYVLLQKRSISNQVFLDFFLSDDLLPKDPLSFPSFDPQLTSDELKLIGRSVFPKTLKAILVQCGYGDLRSLVADMLQGICPSAKPPVMVELPPIEHNFNFLPVGFRISEAEGSMHLPDGHHILFHSAQYLNSGDCVTLFVAIELSEDSARVKPYVVLHVRGCLYTLSAMYPITTDELAPVTVSLDTIGDQKFNMETINKGLMLIQDMLPQVLQKKGIHDMESLLVKMNTSSNPPVISSHCENSVKCWFCRYLCDQCTKAAVLGSHTGQSQFCLLHWFQYRHQGQIQV